MSKRASVQAESSEVVELPWRPGDVVGDQFEVRKFLSGGTTCSVWDGYDQLLHRAVALKVAHDRTPLTHEARALAAVRHEGVPMVYSAGKHQGWPFLALERLVGVTLAHRAPSADEALRVLTALAEVLSAIHGAGLVHHDVRAANVMLCLDGRVVLLELGKGTRTILDAARADRGRAEDIHAFGALAVELLGAELPAPVAPVIAACVAASPAARPLTIDSILWELRAL